MADIETLILEHLRHLRADMDGLREDMRDVKTRLDNIEEQIGGLYGMYASLSRRAATRGWNVSSADWSSSSKKFFCCRHDAPSRSDWRWLSDSRTSRF